MEDSTSHRTTKRSNEVHAAMHPPWKLDRKCMIFIGKRSVAPNLLPIASQVSAWARKKGKLSFLTESDKRKEASFTNPHTYSAASLAAQLASCINQTFDFSSSEIPINLWNAETQRLRLENELGMLFARFCEAAMKQMLYCTNLHPRTYSHATLGHLLAFDCSTCRKDGHPHSVSLLGALAHHYFECYVLESCLYDHLEVANELRNKQAAHSNSPIPQYITVAEARATAGTSVQKIGKELEHMCQHLGELELKMIQEINLYIQHYPNTPPDGDLMQIPARVSDISAL